MSGDVTKSRLAFGQLLRRARRASGLSLEELGDRAGVGVRTISDLERGRTTRPYRQTVGSLAEALGLRGPLLDEFVRLSRQVAEPVPADDYAQLALPSAGGPRQPRPGAFVPRQLPAAARRFAGRSGELAVLAGLLDHAVSDTGPAVVISAIGGMAGVGKTALAVQFARQIADRFPDGQVYVNLRGYDPALPPIAAEQAIRLALDAFQIPAGQIPASPEAQAGLYRSVLADKQALILLDNAADAAQVRPLLPGSPGCLVVITSRSQLAGLVATAGAVPLSLDVLTETEALDLLASIVGQARVAAEPDAARQLIELCGRLPLALAITAARAATRPRLPLAAVAAGLASAAGRLDALQIAGDPLASSVRAALASSYQHLSADAARMLRLLGVHPGPDISLLAAASLAGVPASQAARHLAELTDASLIAQDAAGRYSMHDLVRLYAAEQASLIDSDAERQAATARMLDHYLHTGIGADRLLSPGRKPIAVDPPSAGTLPEHPADDQAAKCWFEAEHRVLIAAANRAFTAGQDARAWNIAWTLDDYLHHQGHWYDQLAVQTAALAAADRLGDLTLQAKSRYYLAFAATSLGRYDEAHTHYRHALDLYQQVGDPTGQANVHIGLADMLSHQGQTAPAAECARQALELYTAAGHQLGQANALNHIGWNLSHLGDYEHALAHCQQALALSRYAGGRHSEAETLDSIGYAHHHLGHHAQAITSYRQALDIGRELGYRYGQAEVLSHLGDTHQTVGDLASARTAWREALAILDDLHHPDAGQVRAKLDAAEAGHAPTAAGKRH